MWEGMEWARSTNQQALFVKLDFEKVYDMIEWDFILSILEALGFGPKFVNIVNMLFNDAYVVLSLNNLQTKAIGLHCFGQQGFSLALSLYVLAAKAFEYLLAKHSNEGKIHGIMLPQNQGQLVNGHFADDSFLTIQEDEQSISEIVECLNTFYEAFDSSIQWSKTFCYRKSPLDMPSWLGNYSWKWIQPREVFRKPLRVSEVATPTLKLCYC